jgi:hypothetical protein
MYEKVLIKKMHLNQIFFRVLGSSESFVRELDFVKFKAGKRGERREFYNSGNEKFCKLPAHVFSYALRLHYNDV